MSLKIVLPLATLVFGGSATVTTGVYFYYHGSGKGTGLGNNPTPDKPNTDTKQDEKKAQTLTEPAGRTDSQASLQDPQKDSVVGKTLDNPSPGSGEGEQTNTSGTEETKTTPVNAPGGDAGSSPVPKDNEQQTMGQADSVPKSDESSQSGDKGTEDPNRLSSSDGQEQDQNQKNGSSGSNPGNGESGTPTLEQTGKEGVENPSTQGSEDKVEGSVGTNKPEEGDGADGKSKAGGVKEENAGGKAKGQEAGTSVGSTEGTPSDTTRTSDSPVS